jgi:hypothetical protein
MAQSLVEVPHARGSLAHGLAKAALVLSAVAGGLLVSGGEAKAQTACGTFPPDLSGACSNGRFTLTPILGPTYPGAPQPGQISDVEIHDLNNPSLPGVVSVDVDFNPDMGDSATGVNNGGEFRYRLDSTGDFFQLARLDSTCPLAGCSVRKYVYSDSGFSQSILGSLNYLESIDGSAQQVSFIGNYTTLYVKDIYSVTNPGKLDNFSNAFQTPGPLSVLGAGAAFGFSRKLRGRIKAGGQS